MTENIMIKKLLLTFFFMKIKIQKLCLIQINISVIRYKKLFSMWSYIFLLFIFKVYNELPFISNCLANFDIKSTPYFASNYIFYSAHSGCRLHSDCHHCDHKRPFCSQGQCHCRGMSIYTENCKTCTLYRWELI